VLVRGATSSVGQAGVAYAKALGNRVIATTRSQANAARLIAIGADHVVIDSGEVAQDVVNLVPGGVDAVLEVIGAATLRDSVKALKPFGTAVVIGLLGGPASLERLELMSDLPGATRIAFFGSGLVGTPALPISASPLPWIAERIAAGSIPSLRVQTFDFDEIQKAHRLIESDRALGKLVVRV
jgi:NADPH2:quinone reductase